jgi:hypothetical protein
MTVCENSQRKRGCARATSQNEEDAMNRSNIFSLSAMRGVGLASTAMLGMLSGAAHAQSAKDLVGTWILASSSVTSAQGAKVEPFGRHPVGSFTFDASGHFTQVIVSSDPPHGSD